MEHRTTAELEAGLVEIRRSPVESGTVELIVRRPVEDQREVLEEGELDPAAGLVGDDWHARCLRKAEDDAPPSPESQLTLMNARTMALLAGERRHWPLAGDQLFVDLALDAQSLPVGTRLALGSAVIEITAKAHNGCRKFRDRFGLEAMKFVASPVGKELKLRGVYARVVEPGKVRPGDSIRRV